MRNMLVDLWAEYQNVLVNIMAITYEYHLN